MEVPFTGGRISKLNSVLPWAAAMWSVTFTGICVLRRIKEYVALMGGQSKRGCSQRRASAVEMPRRWA